MAPLVFSTKSGAHCANERIVFLDLKAFSTYRLPLALISLLFLLWGFGHSFIDVLNSHMEQAFHTTKAQAASVHLMIYGGHLLAALPAGLLVKRLGYKRGILWGLLLYGLGALLFVPASFSDNGFALTLPALFIVGYGLGSLEVAANPYVALLGSPEGAAQRMNMAQAFNGLGLMMGPIIGGFLLYGTATTAHPHEHELHAAHDMGGAAVAYAVLGLSALAIAAVFAFLRLPKADDKESGAEEVKGLVAEWRHILKQSDFRIAMIALFLCVMAQTGLNSVFVYYASSPSVGFSRAGAAEMLGGICMVLLLAGRFVGSYLLRRVKPERMVRLSGLIALFFTMSAVVLPGKWGLMCVFGIYLSESVLYPTIFAVAVTHTHYNAGMASSLLELCVVGGAIAPVLMGYVADVSSPALSLAIPVACFAAIVVSMRRLS